MMQARDGRIAGVVDGDREAEVSDLPEQARAVAGSRRMPVSVTSTIGANSVRGIQRRGGWFSSPRSRRAGSANRSHPEVLRA